ncbi:MAG: nicotinate-nucleotide adenylyltransferase [Phycisphaerae bacterium]|nr:nicotinate-nucleotide adenylyltransferase [Phycisphaerae bacterium]
MANHIVLFGGTFDPVHNAHLIIARAIAEQRGFEKVTFLPAARPPHKSPAHASAADRLAMLRLAIEGKGIFDVCELELSRKGPSYTFETIQTLRKELGRDAVVHLIIGADMLEDLPSWRRADEIVETAEIIVACRPPWDRRLENIFAMLADHFTAEQIRRLRRAVVATPLIDISSTMVRVRVAAGESIGQLVPSAVATYIYQHGLYRQGG